MKQIDFSKLPIGMKVWNYSRREWGEIVDTAKNDLNSVVVEFAEGIFTFTKFGHKYKEDVNPDLFLNSFEIPDSAFEMPMPDLKAGMIIVMNDGKRMNILDAGKEELIYTSGVSWDFCSNINHKDISKIYEYLGIIFYPNIGKIDFNFDNLATLIWERK